VKVKRGGRGTVLAVLAACMALPGLAACAPAHGQAKVTHPAAKPTNVVAVVFTGVGAAAGEITISYPAKVSRAQAEQDLAGMQSVTGWRFASPQLADSRGETQLTAAMSPGAVSAGGGGGPVWPVVFGLRRYARIGVALVGDPYTGPPGQLDNAYVHAVWSGGGGLTSYDVTVLDSRFTGLEQLQQRPRGRGARGPEAAGGGGAHPVPPWLFGVLAIVLAAVAYALVARGLQARDGTDRQQAATSRAWRSRRARNMYK
jgi:hypothetical protein